MQKYRELLKERNIEILSDNENWFDSYLEYNLKRIGVEPTEENKKRYTSNNYKIDRDLDNLKGVRSAGNIIADYIKKNKHIALITDYDADGISSAVVLTKFFQDVLKYNNCLTIVNKRVHGNGFNTRLTTEVEEIHRNNPIDLIITADHGSANNDVFKRFNTIGIKVIVTDHHEIPEELTAALELVNPLKEDSTYIKSTSGCTVAFLTCVATYQALYPNKDLTELYPLIQYAGITTVVDFMDVSIPHNRDIVRTGLNYINSFKDINFNKFRKATSGPYTYMFRDFGFTFGPFLNAGNRTSQEETVFKAFSSSDDYVIDRNLNACIVNNKKRKINQKEAYTDAVKLAEAEGYSSESFAIALRMDIAPGLAGPVANTIGDNFKRPCIIFRNGVEPSVLSGSGRGIIKNFRLLDVLQRIQNDHPDVVIKVGGHYGACGIEIPEEKLGKFKELFNEYTKQELGGVIKPEAIQVDAVLKPDDIYLGTALKTEELGPFGNNWNEPVFISELTIESLFFKYGGLFITFKKTKSNVEGRYWFGRDNGINKTNFGTILKPHSKCLVVYNIRTEYYNKNYSIMLDIIDITPI